MKLFEDFSDAEKDPAARRGSGRVFPSRALCRHRDLLLRRFFGARGVVVVNHGQLVERVVAAQHRVDLVLVDGLGPRAHQLTAHSSNGPTNAGSIAATLPFASPEQHRRDRVTREVGHRAGL